jgi:hypothetical protein
MLCGDEAMSSNTAAMSCNIAAMLGNGALVLDDATRMLQCRPPSLHRAKLMMESEAVMLCRDGVMLQCARVMVRCAGADLFSGLRIPSVDPADGAQARARLAGITSAQRCTMRLDMTTLTSPFAGASCHANGPAPPPMPPPIPPPRMSSVPSERAYCGGKPVPVRR